MLAVSVSVPVCTYLRTVLEQHCPAAGSALHYLTARASQHSLKGNLNKGKDEKNKIAKAEVVLPVQRKGEISQLTNKRKREVVRICIVVCRMAPFKVLPGAAGCNGGWWLGTHLSKQTVLARQPYVVHCDPFHFKAKKNQTLTRRDLRRGQKILIGPTIVRILPWPMLHPSINCHGRCFLYSLYRNGRHESSQIRNTENVPSCWLVAVQFMNTRILGVLIATDK